MCTHFFGIRAIQVGLRGVNVLLAVAILSHFVISLGLASRRAGFGDLFGTIAALGFFGVGAGLLESGLQLLLVKGDQDLAWLDGVAFAHEDFVNAAAHFGAVADVATVLTELNHLAKEAMHAFLHVHHGFANRSR